MRRKRRVERGYGKAACVKLPRKLAGLRLIIGEQGGDELKLKGQIGVHRCLLRPSAGSAHPR